MQPHETLTIRELSEIFGMSRQAMRKHVDNLDKQYISKNPRGYKVVNYPGVLSLADNLGRNELSAQLSQQEKTHQKDYKNNDSEVVSKLSAGLSQQLAVKDEQIEKLQQLLDQQQQLTLQANKQIEKLQEQILLSASEEEEDPEETVGDQSQMIAKFRKIEESQKEDAEHEETDLFIKHKKWWQFWK
ncbi:DUF536 domain-containing protein [Enterococcus devriesei]|uniref:DUF536 domain-containing protein n=1 Tax=Enterococcus devriesei TaxID=319970 RepID=UPI0028ACCDF8|nr:DUF536 domain-containing protein [Enterococcus devriesei]